MSTAVTHSTWPGLGELCPISGETSAEEVANAITHGLGFIASIVGCVALVMKASLHGTSWDIVSFSIYGASLMMLYGASTIYHGCRSLNVKRFFRFLDHAFIYVLIAGSYTPYTLGPLRGAWGWSLFGVVWGVTAVGIPLKAICVHKCNFWSILPYLFLGWLSVVAAWPLLQTLSGKGFAWLIAGGVMYSVGTIFYLLDRFPFNHAMWHLFVLGGSICHYISISSYVIPR